VVIHAYLRGMAGIIASPIGIRDSGFGIRDSSGRSSGGE